MADEEKKQPKAPPHLERNTLTISLFIAVLGIICLPYVEPRGSTWYVLMLVFILNAAIIAWVVARLVRRRRRK